MTGYERICELKKKREEYVRVSQENNMYEGTKKILTDMYPDTAHFIYELLQNAEDMCATNVKFVLYYDRLIFEHNGTKRDFVIEDIDSITSIGNNSLKREIEKTFKGRNFLLDKILSIVATSNGMQYYYINDAIATKIRKKSDVNVSQSDFMKIAQEELGEQFNDISSEEFSK